MMVDPVIVGLWLLGALWIAWILAAVLSAIQVHKFSRVFLQEPRTTFEGHRPRAAVIVPFKGHDDDLPGCIRSLCEQDYPDYHLLLVVESVDDPAYAVLQRELAKYPQCEAQVIVAGLAGNHESQKIHNQLHAMDQVDEADGVLVFADSDAVPGCEWLGDMTGPLLHEGIGMTTGYRWLVPVGDMDGKKSGTHASRLGSVINSSIACAFRKNKFSQAWGGSMAIRAETAEQGNLRSRLTGALTDDYQFTAMCHELGKRLYFVPRCLVATPVQFDWASLFNFAHRQYLITRIYAPMLFYASLLITTLYVAGFVSACIALGRGLLFHLHSDDWVWPGLTLLTVLIANQVRAAFRRRVINRAFGADVRRALKPSRQLDRWATAWCMTIHWLFVLRAAFGRTMTWRGTRYRLYGRQNIKRLDAT